MVVWKISIYIYHMLQTSICAQIQILKATMWPYSYTLIISSSLECSSYMNTQILWWLINKSIQCRLISNTANIIKIKIHHVCTVHCIHWGWLFSVFHCGIIRSAFKTVARVELHNTLSCLGNEFLGETRWG